MGNGGVHGVGNEGGRRRYEGGPGDRGSSGLNPYRIRGFGPQQVHRRFESPSLNGLRAEQGAIVSTFFYF